MEVAVELQNVTRRFKKMTAVDNLSFSVQSGEVFGLLGPNGAGKTTTINLIIGMLRRDEGNILVQGFDPQSQAKQVRRSIGLVPQETNVYGDLNPIDNLQHHAALYCDDLSDIQMRIEELLHLMELWERRKDPVRTFSGGMKRRLTLARAMLHDPKIILFDEPTTGVDVHGRHTLWSHIEDLKSQGITFLISSNDMSEVDALCDRLVIIDHGKAITLDTPEALKATLQHDIVTVQTDTVVADPEALFSGLGVVEISSPEPASLRLVVKNAESQIGEFVERLNKHYRIQSLRIARPTLDDVFLHHTGRALRE
ncbi:MAG: ABC transporter ATP-binding protein [Caldilineae bacterium]|nr:ABC transporter ATP-binding protein [Anaerolineae bacterium]MCB9153230.1 ABC transporter ATP-binding protein [Caldilineae bacterium]